MLTRNNIEIIHVKSEPQFLIAKDLILAYVEWLGFDLAFQNFDKELQSIPTTYGNPNGCLFIAYVNEKAVGVAGIKRFNDTSCEVKRMFVHAENRGLGIGKMLLTSCINLAVELQYDSIKLDTAAFMHSAIKIYKDCGFVEISAYYSNPRDDARYFELVLKSAN